jgi:uncharacterized Zn finger protein (UPF0148 family)
MKVLFCYLKGCDKCGGDLVHDDGDWRCWQCGQYYYSSRRASAGDPLVESPVGCPPSAPMDCFSPYQPEPGVQSQEAEDAPKEQRRKAHGARSTRNINAAIQAKKVSDQRWWARHNDIITHLDKGLSVREIAKLAGVGERQVRVVREKLTDLRSAEEES